MILKFTTINCQTDIQSFGFKGNVKTVKYSIYTNFTKHDSAHLTANKNDLISERYLYFNTIGNIDSTIETLYDMDKTEKLITHFHYANKKLKSTKKYRFGYNDVVEEVKYKYDEKEKTYEFKGISVSSFTGGHRKLDSNYREIEGDYFQKSKKGVIHTSESYINIIDSTGNLIKTKFFNQIKGDYTILYKYKIIDAKENVIQIVLLYENAETIFRFIKKEFTYY